MRIYQSPICCPDICIHKTWAMVTVHTPSEEVLMIEDAQKQSVRQMSESIGVGGKSVPWLLTLIYLYRENWICKV